MSGSASVSGSQNYSTIRNKCIQYYLTNCFATLDVNTQVHTSDKKWVGTDALHFCDSDKMGPLD